MNDGTGVAALRREPPAFRVVAVREMEALTPYMVRVTFSGDSLDGFRVELPAASVRLLLPSPGASELIIPEWNGNEFLLPDGQRPLIRTFTPRRVDPERLEIDLDIVIHDGGAVSAWVRAAESASAAAISGPGRGYAIDEAAPSFLVAGDETAIPAISQLIEHLPHETPVTVIIEIGHRDAQLDLPGHPGAVVAWLVRPSSDDPGATLAGAIREAALPSGVKVWVAGEAAAMHQIRRHLFDDRHLARRDVTVRGYWKHGRSADGDR